jgi:pyruvate ferredoxin oxidoreductase alpha subunit
MNKTLLDGNVAAAWGARLSRAEVIPVFPITPQTEIVEVLAQWIANGEFDAEYMLAESEHSVMSACIGSQGTGVRTFTATSSQGLMLMYEMLWIAAGLRLPIVMANVSRGLSAPITLWPDHEAYMSARPTGWVQFICQDNQEVIDTTIQAYKIAEDKNVLLPVMLNLEGFFLSFTREPTIIPSQNKVDKFLGKYKLEHAYLDPSKAMSEGIAVLGEHMDFRAQHHQANLNALKVTEKVQKDWAKSFGRKYNILDTYKLKDAEVALVTMGCMSTTAKAAVDKMRSQGKKVGLCRLRLITPFPDVQVRKALQNCQEIAVVDRNIIHGVGGTMYQDIVSTLYESDCKTKAYDFIAGLARGVSISDFEFIYKKTKDYSKRGLRRAECWVGMK